MKFSDVVFIAGESRFASVQIRCVEIARRLKCASVCDVRMAKQIPDGYRVYVCVKPVVDESMLEKMNRSGKVVWDILDRPPPRTSAIAAYIASTPFVQTLFSAYGRVEMIPHHHCNHERIVAEPDPKRVGWIGSPHWRPKMRGMKVQYHNSESMARSEVAAAHRSFGIGLNLRAPHPRHGLHVALNSGLKLINCLGFGVPSVSANEPGYRDYGSGCTFFHEGLSPEKAIKQLQRDTKLYETLRENCLAKAEEFHLDRIAKRYAELFSSLR